MNDPIELEYEGIRVKVAYLTGWEYDFFYGGNRYFAHYPFPDMAIEGAKETIRQLIANAGNP